MRERLEQRQAELQAEFEKGQQMLASMQQEQVKLEQTLLRISGAIQLCNEFLTQPSAEPEGGTHGDNS